jgi:hypothetical protein
MLFIIIHLFKENNYRGFTQRAEGLRTPQIQGDTGAGASNSNMDRWSHATAPVSFGKATAPECSASPIHSSISSVVADTRTGSQPIPSISSTRFFRSTIPRTWSPPGGVGRKAEKADQRGPRLFSPVAEQERSAGGAVRVKFLRDGQQVADGMLPSRQSNGTLIAGRMFPEGHVFRRSVGEGEVGSRADRIAITK